MATILENYLNLKTTLDAGMQAAKPDPAQIWQYQELLYRIEVLQVCQMFLKSAPESADVKTIVPHYQMMDAYVQNLMQERQNVAGQDKQPCQTAYNSFFGVVSDYRKRFGSFAPGNDTGKYGKEIAAVIRAVLPAWIQYRETCVAILQKEAA